MDQYLVVSPPSREVFERGGLREWLDQAVNSLSDAAVEAAEEYTRNEIEEVKHRFLQARAAAAHLQAVRDLLA